MTTKKLCMYCSRGISLGNIAKHERSCIKNPGNAKICPACSKPFFSSSTTCSHSCSNRYFRSGSNHPNWKADNYKNMCWEHHGKKCLVCDEEKIVTVHHVNEDHNDNRPENVVPLCPTHHHYVHSRYRNEVQPIIDNYLTNFNQSRRRK